jgi:hypothetical protein
MLDSKDEQAMDRQAGRGDDMQAGDGLAQAFVKEGQALVNPNSSVGRIGRTRTSYGVAVKLMMPKRIGAIVDRHAVPARSTAARTTC